ADRAFEAAWDLHAEQHGAGSQQPVELGLILDLMRHLEIAGILQRLQYRPAKIAVLLQEYSRRQIARRGVDRIAEQDELHQRDHHDHRERHPVAPKLDEFLDQHRFGAAPEGGPPRDSGARWRGRAHWKLSLARLIRSMNTSSSV